MIFLILNFKLIVSITTQNINIASINHFYMSYSTNCLTYFNLIMKIFSFIDPRSEMKVQLKAKMQSHRCNFIDDRISALPKILRDLTAYSIYGLLCYLVSCGEKINRDRRKFKRIMLCNFHTINFSLLYCTPQFKLQ